MCRYETAISGALGQGDLLASLFATDSRSAAQLRTILVASWPCYGTVSAFCSCYSIENSNPPQETAFLTHAGRGSRQSGLGSDHKVRYLAGTWVPSTRLRRGIGR